MCSHLVYLSCPASGRTFLIKNKGLLDKKGLVKRGQLQKNIRDIIFVDNVYCYIPFRIAIRISHGMIEYRLRQIVSLNCDETPINFAYRHAFCQGRCRSLDRTYKRRRQKQCFDILHGKGGFDSSRQKHHDGGNPGSKNVDLSQN